MVSCNGSSLNTLANFSFGLPEIGGMMMDKFYRKGCIHEFKWNGLGTYCIICGMGSQGAYTQMKEYYDEACDEIDRLNVDLEG